MSTAPAKELQRDIIPFRGETKRTVPAEEQRPEDLLELKVLDDLQEEAERLKRYADQAENDKLRVNVAAQVSTRRVTALKALADVASTRLKREDDSSALEERIADVALLSKRAMEEAEIPPEQIEITLQNLLLLIEETGGTKKSQERLRGSA